MQMSTLIVFISTLFSFSSMAQSVFDVSTSVRALGMGGAYVAVVDDADALFYNPAALSRVDGLIWTIIDPRVGASNPDAIQTLQNLQDATTINQTLAQLYGENFWMGGGAKTAVAFPYFGFSYYDRLNVNLQVKDPSFPSLDVTYLNDLGMNLGFAFPVLPGFLTAGVVVKKITRKGFSSNISGSSLLSPDPTALFTDAEKTGDGIGLDIGMNLSFPIPLVRPNFSFVWRDVGRTLYKSTDITLEAPPSDESDMILGAALEVDVPLFTITPTIELRKLNVTGMQLGKKVHMGVELAMPLIDVRGGFYQGYYSLGAGLSLGPLRIDVATYGVELGEYPGQKEDRRYVLQITGELSVGFGFLNQFGFGSGAKSSSARRRLKQRR